jgi:hypothetical protein
VIQYRRRFTIDVGALYRRLPLTLCLLAASAGCGREQQVLNDRASVSGTVTLDGQPLPAGTITFKSQERPITAAVKIREAGAYATNRAPIGKSVVTIDTTSIQVGNPPMYVRIPEKYRDPRTSGFNVEIQPGANENVNFSLEK